MSDEPPNPAQPPAGPGGPFGRFFSARPQGSRYPKAELLPRLLARFTDFVLAAFLPIAAGAPGGILAVLFVLFSDGMLRGQSPGKKLLGIKVVHLPSGRMASYRESALRNFPFALALALHEVPEIGPLLFWTVGPAAAVYEALRGTADPLGVRLGDLLAGTQVVDAKALAGQEAQPVLKLVRSAPERVRGAARLRRVHSSHSSADLSLTNRRDKACASP